MNTEVMFSSASDEWETPKDLFDQWDKKYHFTLDVCATPDNTKCQTFFTKQQDGLSQPWSGRCWMNPPYGRQIKKWVKKAFDESQTNAEAVVCLLPARTDTAWFQDYILHYAEIHFLRGRITFVGAKNPAPFPSMVVVFR